MTSAELIPENNNIGKKTMAATKVDKEAMKAAYDNVRDDKLEESCWVVFKYEGNQVVVASSGSTFEEFKSQFEDTQRAFGYIRIQTGDEMSRRAKFIMVTWVGTDVSAMKRAKMSTDKALVKDIITNFAVELTLESKSELDEQLFRVELNKAGGANYGTGVRE